MRKSFYLISLFALIVFSGCYYDVESELYGESDCSSTRGNYSEVEAVITSNCVACHNSTLSNGGINLDNFDEVKVHANSGKLLGVITHENGYKPMPQGAPQLHPCDIEKINKWIENGALNN